MGGVRKPYLELAGQPLLLHALDPFLAHPAIRWVVVALPPEDADHPPAWLSRVDPRVVAVPGGAERGDSVYRALQRVPAEAEVVLVHDAARPLVTAEVIERVLAAAAEGAGAVAAVPVEDTIKLVDAEGHVLETPERARLWRAQTPQGFPRNMLVRAYERALAAGFRATDDAALVEHFGGAVRVVQGTPENRKVTTPADLEWAEAVLRARQA